jgi:porin
MNFISYIAILMVLLIINLNILLSSDDDSNFFENERISGDWGGFREKIEDVGVSFELIYTGEYWWIVSGNVSKKPSYVDNIDIIFDFDLEELIGAKDFKLSAYFLGNNFDDPNEYVGSYQGVSNIAAYKTWKIFELSLYKDFFDDLFCFKFGLLDLNSEFDVKNTAQVFINPSHGIGPDFAQSGENGPSIFPTTSLALLFRANLAENIYFQTGFFDGVAGHPDNHSGTHIILNNDDGLLVSNSIYYNNGNSVCELLGDCPSSELDKSEKYLKMGFTYWYYTEKYEYIFSHLTNWGFYGLFEMDIYKEKENSRQGLSVHGRIGVANDVVNQFDYYIGGGLVYTGLLPGREKDLLGLGFAFGHNSYPWRLDNRTNDFCPQSFETNIEFTYNMQITPAIHLQPDIQYYINPSELGYDTDVIIFGTRLVLNI